ncbi:MAG: 2-oxoacid:ferredoxin oxidoreductase subunit beta [Acidobacteria bacterium]|nr:2-oxoacid:ferredoxin oxidoreductase subunit beta [Acidobacteriota bacterium]
MSIRLYDEWPDGIGHPLDSLLRTEQLPHVWCVGCGLGTATACLLGALEELPAVRDHAVLVGGIGCTGRAVGYTKLDNFHTTHGRAIPFATGLKLADPSLNVIVFSGDGDLFSIGGNHFIHAARRNVDLLVICCNNFIYGMTGGQVACTTLPGDHSTTTPMGNLEDAFNLPALAEAAGATYVARWTSLHPVQTQRTIREALGRKGFRFIEILVQCPTYYGKYNDMDLRGMVMYLKNRAAMAEGSAPAAVPITKDRIPVGVFVRLERRPFDGRIPPAS